MTGTYATDALTLAVGALGDGSSGGGLSSTQTIWAALGVALISLGGSVFVAWWNGRTMNRVAERNAQAMIAAENTRAANSLAAQKAQADADREADDRRAEQVIKAEDARHEHALSLVKQTRTLEARHDLYISIEAVRRKLDEVSAEFRFASDPDLGDVFWQKIEEHERTLHDLVDQVINRADEASLFGSENVSVQLGELTSAAINLGVLAMDLVRSRSPESSGEARVKAESVLARSRALLAALREELGTR